MPHKSEFLERRLQDLADNIRQDLALLKEYEDALRYADDPRRLARYSREIEKLRESAESYRRESGELRAQVIGEPPVAMQDIDAQLRQMDAKLDTLLERVIELRQAVLARFDASEQAIISAVVERLDENQLATVQAVLDGIDSKRVPDNELQDTLAAVQEVVTEIQQKRITLTDPALASGVERMSEVVDAPKLDVQHKLKVTVPIIPFILSYEGELGLTSGVNLKAVWQRLVAKVRGEQ